MKSKILAGLLFVLSTLAHAANFPIAAGSSVSTIQGIINTAAAASGTNTVTFAAGNYNINSTITVPCSVGTLTIQGPAAVYVPPSSFAPGTYSYNSPYTVNLNGSITNNFGFIVSACSATRTIEYFNWNGGQPSGGGGGWIDVASNNSNLTITNNYIHGNWASTATGHNYDGLIWLDGTPGPSNPDTNDNITWNVLGDGVSDCSPIMNLFSYQGGSYDAHGGNCNGIGVFSSTTNFVIQHNDFEHMEQAVKYFEGGNTTASNTFLLINGDLEYNDFGQLHRNPVEGQHAVATTNPSVGSVANFNNNSLHDMVNPAFASFGFSLPMCCSAFVGLSNDNEVNCNNNVMVGNVQTPSSLSGTGAFTPGAFEWWSVGNCTNNLMQGYWGASGSGANGGLTPNSGGAGIEYGHTSTATRQWIATNNNCQQKFAGGTCITDEGFHSTPPTSTGTITSNTIASTPSVAPSITPASGAQSFPLIVTITDSGYTTGAQPQGNTSIWYTTDGSTPVVGGGSGGGSVGSSGATYYIAPSGSDSNNGTAVGSPWLTPNHTLNCGDTILAAAGNYATGNFLNGKWGTVNCAAGNNVAWLKCATFDTCKITTSANADALWVDKSYWGVQGWEASVTGGADGACFHAGPSGSTSIHHILFANNVANGCMGGGFNAYDRSTTASIDYIAYVGNIAWNTAQGTTACYSGLNVYQPIASDTAAGTHLFAAGNFAYNNVDGTSVSPPKCAGGNPTDGEGINFDTLDFTQGGGPAYLQQAVAENNFVVSNGGRGVYVENSGYVHSVVGAPVFFLYNTAYGNNKDPNQGFCIGNGDLGVQAVNGATVQHNIGMTDTANGCSGVAKYAAEMANCNAGSNTFSSNWLYSAAGHTTFTNACTSSFGSNTTGTDPVFASTTVPGAPACSGTANVPACMATLIANFTPTNSNAKAFGYQTPVNTPVVDSLFPLWLCNTNLPAGLVSSPCTSTGSSTTKLYTAPFTLNAAGTVKAIGMWGSQNQPITYPAGYGFVPSGVTSATYTGSGGINTWYVATSGSNSNPCTAASPCADPVYAETTKANPGDTVQVAAGVYSYAGVQANFSKAGTAGNTITVTCAVIGACTIQNSITGNNAVVLLSGAYVNFKGFIVTNTGAGNNQGIYAIASNINITQNTVHGIETDCTSVDGGIQAASGTSNIVIDSNLVYDISMPAGVPKCGTGVTNTEGINLGTAGGSNTITNNIVYWTSGGWGIAFGPLTGNVACASPLVGNNLIFSTARGALLILCHTVVVQNNIFVYNGTQTNACGLMYDVTGDNPTSGYNDFFSNNGGHYCVGYTPSGSTTVRTHDINSTDPASNTTFINWQANGSGNYQEISGSPTIGTGVASSPTHDYAGAVRPNATGSGWDMGAYSFQGVSFSSITITSAGNVTTLLVGSTNQLKATCNPGAVDCTSLITHWSSSIPGNATISSGGLVTGVVSNVSDLSANIDDSPTGWTNCVIGACASGVLPVGSPGGVNAPGSVHQSFNNASPSLDASGSMLLSLTTLGTATTQTNSQWIFQAPTSCDLCTKFSSSFAVWPGTGSNALGFTMFDNDVTDGLAVYLAGQCNATLGKWQISNATSGWVTTTVSCNLAPSTWHSLQLGGHRVGTTEYFDYVAIDGIVSNIGQTLPITALPAGYASAIGWTTQISAGPQSTATTVTENLDEVAFETTGPAPAFTATLGMLTSPAFPLTITATTPVFSSAYLINASGQNTMGVGSTNQYETICVFSDGTSDSCQSPDSAGIAVSAFTSTAPTVATVTTPGGLVTGVSVGNTDIQAMLNNGAKSSPYTQFIAGAATLKSITISATNGQQTFAVGGTNQILAMCNYSDGTSSPCP